MSAIVEVRGREILDSRGNPTVEAEVRLASGVVGRAAVPSGASTGEHEAVELRDGDPRRFLGKGVLRAVAHVNGEIRERVRGLEVQESGLVDRCLLEADGTPNKSRLGANAILAVSMAAVRAAAAELDLPLYRWLGESRAGRVAETLPVPMFNILNGGAHANNSVDVQEFMVVPMGVETFGHALRAGSEIFHRLLERVDDLGWSTAVGDEGGVAPDPGSNCRALELVLEAVERAGYRPGEDVGLALDCAASEWWDPETGRYILRSGDESGAHEADALVHLYAEWIDRYPILSIEDGLAEDDWEGWQRMTERLGARVQLVGDDLFVTHPARIARGIASGSANAVLVKLNQIGTVTETLEAIEAAQKSDWGVVISHRSGETEDTFIADLAVAVGAGQIKTGSVCRSERVAKYNRLLRIEEELGDAAQFAGRSPYRASVGPEGPATGSSGGEEA